MNKKDKHLAYVLGCPVYYVGGCVRDSFLGVSPKDFDLACGMSPQEVFIKTSESSNFDAKSIQGERFLVSIITDYDGYYRELAQFRRDCLGHAVESNMQDDAARRDFTINALYRNVTTGEVLDPTGKGLSDIIDKKIRFIGDPSERIKEDPLRVYRGYRFFSKLRQYGFEFEKETLKAIRGNFEFAQKNTAPERVRVEIEKIIGIGA